MTNKELIRKLNLEGKSNIEIANVLGISRQRIHQVLRDYRSFSSRAITYAKYPNLSINKICVKCKIQKATEISHKDNDCKNNIASNLEKTCHKCNMPD